MTEAQARTAANVVLAAAVIGAAYYVLKTPSRRRKAWEAARAWATGTLPIWAATEVRRAWDASAPAHRLRMGYGETGPAGPADRSAMGGAVPSRVRAGG